MTNDYYAGGYMMYHLRLHVLVAQTIELKVCRIGKYTTPLTSS